MPQLFALRAAAYQRITRRASRGGGGVASGVSGSSVATRHIASSA